MKLILTDAVDNLGVAGDIVDVKPGYGRNFLLPRGLAVVATRGAVKQIEAQKRFKQSKVVRDNDHARELKSQLEAMEGITLKVKASDKGKLFGSVVAADVAEAITNAEGPTIDPSLVKIAKGSIKTTGTHTVVVELADDIAADITVEVEAA